MQTILYIFISILTIAVIYIFLWAKRGIPHPANDLKSPIIGLLRQGYDGGYLLIKVSFFSKNIIQLRKYITDSGEFGIQFTIPKVKWSQSLIPKVKQYCKLNNFEYTIENNYLDGGLSFLIVDFKKDWQKTSQFCENIFVKTLNLKPGEMVYTTLENASTSPIHEI